MELDRTTKLTREIIGAEIVGARNGAKRQIIAENTKDWNKAAFVQTFLDRVNGNVNTRLSGSYDEWCNEMTMSEKVFKRVVRELLAEGILTKKTEGKGDSFVIKLKLDLRNGILEEWLLPNIE